MHFKTKTTKMVTFLRPMHFRISNKELATCPILFLRQPLCGRERFGSAYFHIRRNACTLPVGL